MSDTTIHLGTIHLGDVGAWVSGSTPAKSNNDYWGGSIPWVSPKDMKVFRILDTADHVTERALAKTNLKTLPAESVLVVVRSGILAHSLPVAITKGEVTINQDLKAVTPTNGIEADYLAWFLRSAEKDILDHCTKSGTTVSSVKTSALMDFEMPLVSNAQQRRIVSKIEELFSELDAGIEALERAKTKLERYRASVLQAAVEGRLTEAWRAENPPKETGEELLERILAERRTRWEEEQLAKYEAKGKKPPKNWKSRYKEPAAPDTSELPNLPEGWCWASIDHLAYGMSNGRSVRTKAGGFPVLRLTAIDGWTLDLSERKEGDWTRADAERFLIQEDDFLIARGNGSLDLVGRGARAVGPVDEVAFPDTMIRIKTSNDVVRVSYLAVAWDCSFVRRQLEAAAKTTAGIYKVNQQDIRQVLLPVPPPAEQDELTGKLEAGFSLLDALEMTRSASAAKGDVLRQSILKMAFEGRLVPQDASDEPASALLERIRAERDGKQPVKRPRSKNQSSQPELEL